MRNSIHKTSKAKSFAYTLNKVRLVRGGHDYFRTIVEMISQARISIYMQTYILEDDETGKLVSTALIAAAKRNVKIYVLVDGYASQHLSDQFITDLTSTGIHFRFFEPLFKSENFYFGRRLHSKVIVVDSQIAIAGGVNITNRYNDLPG